VARGTRGRMQPHRFRPLVEARAPFATVVVDDSHDTADADTQVDLRWRAVAEQLRVLGARDAVIDALGDRLRTASGDPGRHGRALIAGADGVLLDQRLVRAPEQPTVRVSDLPYLVPVVLHGVDDPPYLTVITDHAGADLTVHHGARAAETSTVTGRARPVHKASGAESPGYGAVQRTADNARAANIGEEADTVVDAFDHAHPQVVFVAGEVRSRADMIAALPSRVAERVVEVNAGARGSVDEDALAADIETHLRLRRVDALEEAASRFRTAAGGEFGLATEGLAGVCAALREGAVETLIVGELGDATVVVGESPLVVAPTVEVLSELGAASSSVARADEVLPFAAVMTDADLIGMDARLSMRDGVAAVLRYVPQTAAS
jgi:peptide chain release factor subunit 1